jgi:hypothetical protein
VQLVGNSPTILSNHYLCLVEVPAPLERRKETAHAHNVLDSTNDFAAFAIRDFAERNFKLVTMGDLAKSVPHSLNRSNDIAMVTSGISHALVLHSNGTITGWSGSGSEDNMFGQATVPPLPAGRSAAQVSCTSSCCLHWRQVVASLCPLGRTTINS